MSTVAYEHCTICDEPLVTDADHEHGGMCAACVRRGEEARKRLGELRERQAALAADMLEDTRKLAAAMTAETLREWVMELTVENRALSSREIELESDLEEARSEAQEDEQRWRAECDVMHAKYVATYGELDRLRRRWLVRLFYGGQR